MDPDLEEEVRKLSLRLSHNSPKLDSLMRKAQDSVSILQKSLGLSGEVHLIFSSSSSGGSAGDANSRPSNTDVTVVPLWSSTLGQVFSSGSKNGRDCALALCDALDIARCSGTNEIPVSKKTISTNRDGTATSLYPSWLKSNQEKETTPEGSTISVHSDAISFATNLPRRSVSRVYREFFEKIYSAAREARLVPQRPIIYGELTPPWLRGGAEFLDSNTNFSIAIYPKQELPTSTDASRKYMRVCSIILICWIFLEPETRETLLEVFHKSGIDAFELYWNCQYRKRTRRTLGRCRDTSPISEIHSIRRESLSPGYRSTVGREKNQRPCSQRFFLCFGVSEYPRNPFRRLTSFRTRSLRWWDQSDPSLVSEKRVSEEEKVGGSRENTHTFVRSESGTLGVVCVAQVSAKNGGFGFSPDMQEFRFRRGPGSRMGAGCSRRNPAFKKLARTLAARFKISEVRSTGEWAGLRDIRVYQRSYNCEKSKWFLSHPWEAAKLLERIDFPVYWIPETSRSTPESENYQTSNCWNSPPNPAGVILSGHRNKTPFSIVPPLPQCIHWSH